MVTCTRTTQRVSTDNLQLQIELWKCFAKKLQYSATSQLMHVDLHWLDVPERKMYKLVTMVYNCLHGKAPSYLTDCCTPISDVASRRSASRRQLLIPRHNLSTYGRRAFSVAGPAAWNCLCDELREPLLTANSFRQLLKTRLFAEY